MLAGGVDSNANGSIPYPNNDLHKLLSLNQLVAFLKIDSLENRTFRRIDGITRNEPQSFEQMTRLFSVAGIPSQTHKLLKRNLWRWVAALSDDEWKKSYSQASTHSDQKSALIILSKLRFAVEEKREMPIALKTSKAYRRSRSTKEAATWTRNETRGNVAPDNMGIAGAKPSRTQKELKNTRKQITGLSTTETTTKTGSESSKPNTKVWQQGELEPPSNGDVYPMMRKPTSISTDTAGATMKWRTGGKPASKHIAPIESSKEPNAPAEPKPK